MTIRVLALTVLGCVLGLFMPEEAPRDDLRRLAEESRELRAQVLAYDEKGNTVYLVSAGKISTVYDPTPGKRRIGHPAIPALSADGRFVAFVRATDTNGSASTSTGPRREALAVTDIQAGTTRDLLEWERGIYALAWSPDGLVIAMVAEGEKRYGLYVVNVQSRQVSELTSTVSVSTLSPPSWSPDGHRLAVAIKEHPGTKPEYRVAIVEQSTGKLRMLESGRDPVWSPQGDVVAYLDTKQRNCYSIRLDRTAKKKLFSAGWTNPSLIGPLHWLPGGKSLGFHYLVGEGPAYAFFMRRTDTRRNKEIYPRSSLIVAAWHGGS